jgi:FMN-dependent NADH-azoreductase
MASDGRTILRVDSGVDHGRSVSRQLADRLMERLVVDGDVVVERDVSDGLPYLDSQWHAAAFGGPDPSALALSEELTDELLTADELVLVAPVYNLAVPAPLKCWIDHVVREGRTYRFTEHGTEGLATNTSRAWIVTASGGTPIGGPYDFNTTYLTTILGVIGVFDVRIVGAHSTKFRGQDAVDEAHRTMDEHLATIAGA